MTMLKNKNKQIMIQIQAMEINHTLITGKTGEVKPLFFYSYPHSLGDNTPTGVGGLGGAPPNQ